MTNEAAKTVRVMLVDDHVLFRRGLVSLLSTQQGMVIVGEAGDGWEAVEKARAVQPDIVLMDIRMPGLDGIEATRRILASLPQTRVLALTVSELDSDLFQAIKAGAQGYLLKDVSPEELLKAIQGTLRGEATLSPRLASHLLAEFSRFEEVPVETAGRLTRREEEILRLVAQGASNKHIASELGISESTVRNHVHHILEKLHLHNRVQAAIYIRSHGQAVVTTGG